MASFQLQLQHILICLTILTVIMRNAQSTSDTFITQSTLIATTTKILTDQHRREMEIKELELMPLDMEELYHRVESLHNVSVNKTHNGDDDDDDDDEEYDDDMLASCYDGQNTLGNLIATVLYATVCVVGLFGNTLVIYVVLRFSKMQTVTNIYILNLAIADECFLIGIPFLLYTMHIGSWQFGEYICKAYMVSTSITQFTSSIFLLIMAADRYIAVCHPITSPRYRTPLVSKLVSLFAWLMSALLMLPVMLFASTVQYGDHVTCNIKWPAALENSEMAGTTFILYTLVLGFAAPLSLILVFYCLVIRKLHLVGMKHKSKEKKRSHRKVTRLVLTVITVYVLCWLPYWIAQMVLITIPAGVCVTRMEILIYLLVGCLGYSNSAMNPLMYAFLSDNFKKSFMKAFIWLHRPLKELREQLRCHMLAYWCCCCCLCRHAQDSDKFRICNATDEQKRRHQHHRHHQQHHRHQQQQPQKKPHHHGYYRQYSGSSVTGRVGGNCAGDAGSEDKRHYAFEQNRKFSDTRTSNGTINGYGIGSSSTNGFGSGVTGLTATTTIIDFVSEVAAEAAEAAATAEATAQSETLQTANQINALGSITTASTSDSHTIAIANATITNDAVMVMCDSMSMSNNTCTCKVEPIVHTNL